MKPSRNTHGMHPASVRAVNRQKGMRATPAGREMNVRTIGSIRLKNTVGAPQRSNQRSAHCRWLGLMCNLDPWRSSRSTRP